MRPNSLWFKLKSDHTNVFPDFTTTIVFKMPFLLIELCVFLARHQYYRLRPNINSVSVLVYLYLERNSCGG